VFTKEVVAGLPRYRAVFAQRVGPVLQAEVRTFERWAQEGRIARINFTHLMFVIWSITQAYADQGGAVCPATWETHADSERLRASRRGDLPHGVGCAETIAQFVRETLARNF
jgi:hypothetical protein